MRKLTFRSIFICLCVLVSINICVNLFTGASTHQELDTDGIVRTYSPPAVDTFGDFFLDYQYNGDIIIYAVEYGEHVYVGTYKHGTKCDLQQMMQDYMTEND